MSFKTMYECDTVVPYNDISWCYIIALLSGTFEANNILASLLFKSNGYYTPYKTST